MFLNYIHSYRALAIFMIVAGHGIDAFVWQVGSITEQSLRIFVSNGSTLFVFIAGYLFQHLSTRYETRKYLRAKLRNVIVPYLLVSIPAIVIFTTVLPRESIWPGFYDNPVWLQVILFYLSGAHLAPFWFIPMITLFYLAAPLLVRADRNQLIYLALPALILLSCVFGRGLPHESFVHFFSVYLLGMAASRYKEIVNPRVSNNGFLTTGGIIVVALALIEFHFMDGTMTWVNYLQKLTLSLLVLGLLVRFGTHFDRPAVNAIADASFGIFFLHSYVISGAKILYGAALGSLPDGTLAAYIVLAPTILLASAGLVLFVKRQTGMRSRLLIGS